jgi:hypothetical protein
MLNNFPPGCRSRHSPFDLLMEAQILKYMLFIYHDEQAWNRLPEAEHQELYSEYRLLIQELQSSGQYLVGDQLQPATTASSVRVRDGKQLVTDGPLGETRGQVGGFFMIDANDLDEAIRIAARIPSARMGTVEVRPVVESAAATPA